MVLWGREGTGMNKQAPRYRDYMYSYPHKTAYRPFERPVDIGLFVEKVAGQRASLYFHIPFCRYKCGFCNLFSRQGCGEAMVDDYLDAMWRQARQLSALTAGQLRFDAFAIGGGTPLVLSAAQLNRLFEMAALFGVTPAGVLTSIETSPDYTDMDVLQLLREKGVGRLSIGVQSFFSGELEHLKRGTSVAVIEAALERVRRMGFPRFNIDLIYGVEGQTVDSFLFSIQKALYYHPTELFIYPLYVRKGVGISGKARNEVLLEMYHAGRAELLRQGFKQTSMRRFVGGYSAEGEYSCGDEVMLSCGCGGRSYMGRLHFAAPYAVGQQKIRSIIDHYIQTADFTFAANGFMLSEEEVRRRYVIMNLLYHRGVDKVGYAFRFGRDVSTFALLGRLVDKGLAEDTGGFIRLTGDGLSYADDIGPLFISPEVRGLMDSFPLE